MTSFFSELAPRYYTKNTTKKLFSTVTGLQEKYAQNQDEIKEK